MGKSTNHQRPDQGRKQSDKRPDRPKDMDVTDQRDQRREDRDKSTDREMNQWQTPERNVNSPQERTQRI